MWFALEGLDSAEWSQFEAACAESIPDRKAAGAALGAQGLWDGHGSPWARLEDDYPLATSTIDSFFAAQNSQSGRWTPLVREAVADCAAAIIHWEYAHNIGTNIAATLSRPVFMSVGSLYP